MSGMETLPAKVLDFVAVEPAAVLALPMDERGSIHAAPLIFWLDPEDNSVYFVTGRNTDKCKQLIKNEVQASCVLGTSKGTEFCLQMRGRATIADPKAFSRQLEAYYKKRGNRNEDINDPANVLVRFVPEWIRVTDYTNGLPVRTEMSLS